MENQKFQVDQYLIVGAGIRFVHYLIDLVFIYLFIIILAIAVAMVAVLSQNQELLDDMENMNDFYSTLLAFLVMTIYYGSTEIFLSRSIAKFITGTVVVMEDGSKPSKLTMLGRTFSRFIPFDALSYLFRSPARGFHDTITGTYVVKKKAFEIEMLAFKNKQSQPQEQTAEIIQPNPEIL